MVLSFSLLALFGSYQKYYNWRQTTRKAQAPKITVQTVPKAPKNSQPQILPDQSLPQPAPTKNTYVPPSTPPPVVVPSPQSSVSNLTPVPASPSGSGSSTSTSSASGGSVGTTQLTYSSLNWSGYLAANGKYTGISGSWTVPSVTGNATTTSSDAAWIGIGGVTTADLIQVGTYENVASNGVVTYAGFYEMLPDVAITIPGMLVGAGDTITASILEVSAGRWSVVITNARSNQTFSKTVNYNSTYSSAEWIEEDPSNSSGKLLPLDHFGSVSFSNSTCVIGGVSVGLSAAQAQMVFLVNRNGQKLAIPTAIDSVLSGFTVNQVSP